MPETAPYVTARNPYALAESVLGAPVDWSSIEDRAAFLEEVLQTPYEQLFDPKYGSPVYLGSELDQDQELVPAKFRAPIEVDGDRRSDADAGPADIEPHVLADLEPVLGEISELSVRNVVPSRAGGWTIEVGPSADAAEIARDRIFNKTVLESLWDTLVFDRGWTPANGEWNDIGHFFNEAAEFFDPVQGSLGDCWLIAALSSVAWANPTAIADRSRAVGAPNDRFKHRLEFTDPADGSTKTFEVSDHTVTYQGTSSPIYARSSEPGEIWPAVIEKAFAQWRSGTTHDHPNLTVLNGGDPVWASAALTGRAPQYTWHAGQSTASIRTLVKSHCQAYRTIDPMTSWTHGTAPEGLSYGDANIVGGHAYSILGWTSAAVLHRSLTERLRALSIAGREALIAKPAIASLLAAGPFTREYIVLRNPWGFHEATAGALTGSISMHDVDFWRSIPLADVDGVFAIPFSTYVQYFAGTGVAL